MGFLTGRNWRWWDSLTLVAYAAVVAAGIGWHEPWADEAQAWLLARDMSWWQMVAHGVRYEGSPALWHTLLWLLIRMHLGYAAMHWVAGAISVAGIAVFLRYAPFPPALRLLLPFTFFLAYQDAVVARSYVLFGVLAFAAAAVLRERRLQSPLLLAVLLGLMANISVHGFVASAGLTMTAALLWRRSSPAKAMYAAAAIVCCFWLVAAATALPPPDVDFPAGKNLERSWQGVEATAGVKGVKKPVRRNEEVVFPGELTPVSPIVHHRTALQSLWLKIARILSVITFPLSALRLLALSVFVLLLALGFRGGGAGWPGLLPYLLLILVFAFLYLAPRHTGMIFVTFVVSAWLIWPQKPTVLSRVLLVAMLLMTIEQIGWTAHAVWRDIHGPYSGDVATARFLHEHAGAGPVDGFYYHSVGPLAYFPRNIYENQPPHGYWLWSTRLRIDQRAPFALADHPRYIVVGGWDWGREGDITFDWVAPPPELNRIPMGDAYGIIPFFERHGYRETHRFCGDAWMRGGYAEQLCQVVLEPAK